MNGKYYGRLEVRYHKKEAARLEHIRIFASTDPNDPGVKKVKASNGRLEKLQNSPEHCFIYNDDVKDVRVPDKLDRQWYINFANKRLEDFGVS